MKDDVQTVLRGPRLSLTKGAAKLTATQRATLAKGIGYLDANNDRMPYRSFVGADCPIGTGSFECGVRHLIGDRMTRTGTRWAEAGAQAMLHVRGVHINGEMADFHDERIKREQERMSGVLSAFSA